MDGYMLVLLWNLDMIIVYEFLFIEVNLVFDWHPIPNVHRRFVYIIPEVVFDFDWHPSQIGCI